jgi:beta-glucanase (GH16 family)
MSTQAWGSGRWDDARCVDGCLQTSGDYVPEAAADYTYNLLSPVASAKLHTRTTLDVRYGKVEVRAKLPKGDWLWPAIWMLPSFPDNYGAAGLADG